MSHRVAYGSSPEEMIGLTTSPFDFLETPSHLRCNSSRPMICFRHLLWPKGLDSENRDRRSELVLMHRVASLFCPDGDMASRRLWGLTTNCPVAGHSIAVGPRRLTLRGDTLKPLSRVHVAATRFYPAIRLDSLFPSTTTGFGDIETTRLSSLLGSWHHHGEMRLKSPSRNCSPLDVRRREMRQQPPSIWQYWLRRTKLTFLPHALLQATGCLLGQSASQEEMGLKIPRDTERRNRGGSSLRGLHVDGCFAGARSTAFIDVPGVIFQCDFGWYT